MEMILANTIQNLSRYINEIEPDLIVIHGDRIEALAGAIVGALSNVLVAHIEGGESSGSIDESLRHSISKLSHIHFVSNNHFAKRLIKMGENPNNIYVIGSPDYDIMFSDRLPSISKIKNSYCIDFNEYGILLFHSVTTEINDLRNYCNAIVNGVINSKKPFVVIYPNNDAGVFHIINEYARFSDKHNFKVFRSLPFEDFLVLLKNAKCIVGNSSAGVRQAPAFGVPTVNIGSRQDQRNNWVNINNVDYDADLISHIITREWNNDYKHSLFKEFGDGTSDSKFISIIEKNSFWLTSIQK
jgi:UDP-N-acetylglucosamine 2-epimerase (hydrolysing)